MDSPGYVRPAGNGPKGETGTAVKYLKKQRAFKARRFFDTTSIGRGSARMGVEVHCFIIINRPIMMQ